MGGATDDEPTAIRRSVNAGRWHRYRMSSMTFCGREAGYMNQRIPLSQTAPADRCRSCWPTPKETP